MFIFCFIDLYKFQFKYSHFTIEDLILICLIYLGFTIEDLILICLIYLIAGFFLPSSNRVDYYFYAVRTLHFWNSLRSIITPACNLLFLFPLIVDKFLFLIYRGILDCSCEQICFRCV